MDAVNALGGVSMNVPYPVRDYGDCDAERRYTNCTGLEPHHHRVPGPDRGPGACTLPLPALRVVPERGVAQ